MHYITIVRDIQEVKKMYWHFYYKIYLYSIYFFQKPLLNYYDWVNLDNTKEYFTAMHKELISTGHTEEQLGTILSQLSPEQKIHYNKVIWSRVSRSSIDAIENYQELETATQESLQWVFDTTSLAHTIQSAKKIIALKLYLWLKQ